MKNKCEFPTLVTFRLFQIVLKENTQNLYLPVKKLHYQFPLKLLYKIVLIQ